MKLRLLRAAILLGALVIVGGVGYAAWTQGEATGYARGYDTGKRDEKAADKPKLTVDIVKALATTGKPEIRNQNCILDASYAGGGLWIVSVSNDKTAYQKAQVEYQEALSERRRIAYEKARQEVLERVRLGKPIFAPGELTGALDIEAEAERRGQAAADRVPSLGSPPSPTLCRTSTFAVSDRTGNVTGP